MNAKPGSASSMPSGKQTDQTYSTAYKLSRGKGQSKTFIVSTKHVRILHLHCVLIKSEPQNKLLQFNKNLSVLSEILHMQTLKQTNNN